MTLYRWLLDRCPSAIRDGYGPAMLETFERRARDARHRGAWAFAWFVIRECLGLLFAAAREMRLDPRERSFLFGDELRIAARRLAESPGFALSAVVTLGLGLGATTAVFSLVDSVLLRPLPFEEPEQLVRVEHRAPGAGFETLNLSRGIYRHYREQNRSFEVLALFRRVGFNLTGEGEPERIAAVEASFNLGELLRIRPLHGRSFELADETPAPERVVMLGYGLWSRRFGGDPAVVGRTLRLDGAIARIVGVLPPGLRFPVAEAEMWVALTIDPEDRGMRLSGFPALGRLVPGVSPELANANLESLIPGLTEAYPGLTQELLDNLELGTIVTPLKNHLVADIQGALWLLLAGVFLVFVIAAANVTNLFLVRSETRRRELALRAALGASASRLWECLLAESVIASAAAGVVGAAVASVTLRVVKHFGGVDFPRLDEVALDPRALAVTAVLAVSVALASAAAAATRAQKSTPSEALRDGGRGLTAGRSSLSARNALVVTQVALAVVLLTSSGLLLRSFWRLRAVEPGFDPTGVITLRVGLPRSSFPDQRAAAVHLQQFIDRLATIPGVSAVGAVGCLPLTGCFDANSLEIEGRPPEPNRLPPRMALTTTGPGLFRAMRIPVLAGRTFDRRDHEERSGALVISEAVARRFWPGEDPIGKRVFPGLRGENEWYEIVGVVGNVRLDDLTETPGEIVYLPMVNPSGAQYSDPRNMVLVVRGSTEPTALVEPARQAIFAVDPELPVAEVRTLREVLDASTRGRRLALLLTGAAAVAALFLGAVGLYGTLSYLTRRRIGEMGLRMALGAGAWDVRLLVLRHGGWLTGIGLVLGLVLSLLAGRLLKAFLFELSPVDPVTLSAVVVTLLGVALAAVYAPAREASRVDPVVALRAG